MSERQISQISKHKLKSIVKSKIKEAALDYLKEVQRKHSKMDLLRYNSYQIQEYLHSPLFNDESRQLLFRLRTRTVSGVRCDFKGIYSDTSCPMGCGQSDTIQHMLSCVVWRRYHQSTHISVCETKFEEKCWITPRQK